jgi:hypothetical protein
LTYWTTDINQMKINNCTQKWLCNYDQPTE